MENIFRLSLVLGGLLRESEWIRVVKLMLYVFIFIMGIIGNMLVCLVVS